MDVVELEALNARPVDERGMRRGELRRSPPHRTRARRVERRERVDQNLRPLHAYAVECAAERIEDQKFDAVPHLVRNLLVTKARDECREPPRIWIGHIVAGSE